MSNFDAPAFPMHWENDVPGMALRDFFAAHALANAYAQSELKPDDIAEWAYQIADAMLLARGEA